MTPSDSIRWDGDAAADGATLITTYCTGGLDP